MKVTGTDFVFLPISDFDRSEAFYTAVLGLECSKRYRDGIGGEFETGNLSIQVVDTAKIGIDVAPSTGAIALHVDDVQEARKELEAQGIEFQGEILDSGVCFQAYFRDPDGNALILHNRYAPPGMQPGD
jgi:catechol 2,3-dioxygenase-like lactoylglutathione lyase family enzyme